MNIAELIEELRKHPPGKPVKVCTRSAFVFDEVGDHMLTLCENDADLADEVRNEGGFVLIWGGKA